MIEIIKIGNIEIKRTAALAPMAGVADRAFREICKQYKASYVESEMISSKALCYGDKKTEKLLSFTDIEKPIALQLFGSDPEYLAKAAYLCLNYKPDIIDINMGCPTRKITSNDSGSALLKDPKLIGEIVKNVVKAVNIPVSVKIRSGWDENNINAVEIAKIIEFNGASAITIHGRTRQQMYSSKSSIDIIKQVKQAVKITVIGNGDITDLDSALEMYQKTGCDLIMIGRGTLGNPWIFKQIYNYFKKDIILDKPLIDEKISVMKQHVKLMIKYSPSEKIALTEARKHINWYLKGFKNAAIIRNKISKITTLNELDNILGYYLIKE